MLGALSILEIFKFLFWVIWKQLDKKAKANFKNMTLPTGQQIITLHILSNIWRSKGNKTIKFGQSIEINMRNIFHEKSYAKFGGEAVPRPFYKKSKFSMALDQQSEFLKFVFIVCPSRGQTKYIKTEVLIVCFYLL